MAHKTFISYKYDEAQGLRDKIIRALGNDVTYYKGETSDSPDLTDRTTETIREHLKNMIYGTSVTIVVISPHMLRSKWIDWEIAYSLRECKRGDQRSRANGVVGVIMNDPCTSSTDWIEKHCSNSDGCNMIIHDTTKLFNIINANRFNQTPKEYVCATCKTVDILNGSYIALVDEGDFLRNPARYIDNAYDKSQKLWNYNLCKTR